MRWLALGLLVGCGDGIFIEIQAPPGTKLTEAELIIGDRDCDLDGQPCKRIAPEMFKASVDAELDYQVDSALPITAAFAGDTAEFDIQPGSGRVDILVLGTAADGSHAIAVMQTLDLSDSPRRYVVPLVNAKPMAPAEAPGVSGDRFAIWGRARRCVGMQDSRTGRGPVFVLPEADPDCDDDVIDHECRRLAFSASEQPAPDSDANCAAFDATPACFLGRSACDETATVDEQCHGIPFCLSDTVCSCGPGDGFMGCALDTLSGAAGTVQPTFLFCPLGVEPDGTGNFKPCNSGVAADPDLGLEAVVPTATACPSGGLATLDTPIKDFGPIMVMTSGGGNISATLAPQPATRCRQTIAWDGQVDGATVLNMDTIRVLAAIDLVDVQGGTVLETVVVPVELGFVNDCTTVEQRQCVVKNETANGADFASCLR